jgi:UDP-N-acetylmuramate dehydrogenase
MRLPNEFRAHCPRSFDHALARDVTLGFGGAAGVFFEPRDVNELADVILRLRELDIRHRLLGGGSNVLIADAGADVVISTRRAHVIARDPDLAHGVVAEAGAALSSLVTRARGWGLSGLECLAGIPGTVGAAVAINAGGKFGCIGKHVRRVAMLRPDGRLTESSVSEADFGYRCSVFARSVILKVWLQLEPASENAIRARIHEVVLHKKSTQPLAERSAGCVFKNPPGDAAGRLIDRAGLKGRRVGRARISEMHANYFVNEGGATARDFLALMDLARGEVLARFGVALEPEVDVWA